MKKYKSIIQDLEQNLNYVSIKTADKILSILYEKRSDILSWPITMSVGDIIPDNNRVIERVQNILDGYGFYMLPTIDDKNFSIDLMFPDEENAPNLIPEEEPEKIPEDYILKHEDLVKGLVGRRDKKLISVFKDINHRIQKAIGNFEHCISIKTKEEPLNNIGFVIKRVYNSFIAKGYRVETKPPTEKNKKPEFDKITEIVIYFDIKEVK